MNEEKLSQLQLIEQNVQQLLMQKQQFQAQLAEIESAQKELESTSLAYKIIGNIMVQTEKPVLLKELAEKREMIELRLKSIERQEDKLREKAKSIQKEVLGSEGSQENA